MKLALSINQTKTFTRNFKKYKNLNLIETLKVTKKNNGHKEPKLKNSLKLILVILI